MDIVDPLKNYRWQDIQKLPPSLSVMEYTKKASELFEETTFKSAIVIRPLFESQDVLFTVRYDKAKAKFIIEMFNTLTLKTVQISENIIVPLELRFLIKNSVNANFFAKIEDQEKHYPDHTSCWKLEKTKEKQQLHPFRPITMRNAITPKKSQNLHVLSYTIGTKPIIGGVNAKIPRFVTEDGFQLMLYSHKCVRYKSQRDMINNEHNNIHVNNFFQNTYALSIPYSETLLENCITGRTNFIRKQQDNRYAYIEYRTNDTIDSPDDDDSGNIIKLKDFKYTSNNETQ